MPPLPPQVQELLEAPNVVHLATRLADGSPHSVAIWAGVHEGRPVFFTTHTSQKGRNLERDPRLALSVTDRHNPYRTAWVRGRVIETLTGDAANEIIDRIARDYTGEPFPIRTTTAYIVEPERTGHVELPHMGVPPADR